MPRPRTLPDRQLLAQLIEANRQEAIHFLNIGFGPKGFIQVLVISPEIESGAILKACPPGTELDFVRVVDYEPRPGNDIGLTESSARIDAVRLTATEADQPVGVILPGVAAIVFPTIDGYRRVTLRLRGTTDHSPLLALAKLLIEDPVHDRVNIARGAEYANVTRDDTLVSLEAKLDAVRRE